MNDRAIFSLILGCIAFAADVLGIYQFITTSGFKDFWSFHWIVSIAIIILLTSILIFWVSSLNRNHAIKIVTLFFFGLSYSVFAAIIYVSWGQRQVEGALGLDDFSGFLTLFFVSLIIACVSIYEAEEKFEHLRFTSYGIALANISVLYFLIQKYIINHAKFDLSIFSGEVSIVTIGAILFLSLFKGDDKLLWNIVKWLAAFYMLVIFMKFKLSAYFAAS